MSDFYTSRKCLPCKKRHIHRTVTVINKSARDVLAQEGCFACGAEQKQTDTFAIWWCDDYLCLLMELKNLCFTLDNMCHNSIT